MNKRYYINGEASIDLEEVVGIVAQEVISFNKAKTYSYEIAFKSGTKLTCYGANLRSQFAEYKGLTEEVKTKE